MRAGAFDSNQGPRGRLAGVRVGGGAPVRIMAVINVSPESFYGGSVYRHARSLRQAAQRAVEEGADFIDIGAMSTAPYLDTHISEAEERRRLVWALQVVAEAVEVPLSADTTRAGVARAALAAGACIINDVTGLRGDPEMAAVVASAAGAILVASQPARGRRASLAGVVRLLRASLARAERAGVALERIVLDPGIGFFPGSRPPPERFNCLLLARLRSLQRLGRPLLVGVSRKSFIGRLTGRELPDDRLPGSLAATALAVYNGAAVVRAHDVAATRDAVGIAQAIARARTPLTPGRASR